MSENWKPCPFCGCTLQGVEESPGMAAIVCGDCGCKMEADHFEAALIEWNRRASGWVAVSERLPKEDGIYFIYPEGKYHGQEVGFTARGFKGDEGAVPPMSFYWVQDLIDGYVSHHVIQPTHWMRMPDAPTDLERKGER